MKTIKIKFVGFWNEFDDNNNFIINLLKKHYAVELSDEPEYVFSSCFSDEYLDYECVRIFYTGENLVPDFNAFDYAIGYEYLDYGDRYMRYTDYAIPEEYGTDCSLMRHKHELAAEQAGQKSEFCSFVVSKGNGHVAKERESFFKMLSDYKKVNSGGRFLNNIGQPEGVKDKLEFQKRHKFAIAFENSSHPGYSTEKIVQAFAAGCIPIYWGDPLISRDFNEASFVNCHQYKDFQSVVEAIRQIDHDPVLYERMLAEPALVDPDFVGKLNRRLETFLCHIIDQPIETAYRRDRVGYNQAHVERLQRRRRFQKTFLGKAARFLEKRS
jgi:hypothetical protein